MGKREYTDDDIEAFKKSDDCPFHLCGADKKTLRGCMKKMGWKPPLRRGPIEEIDTEPIILNHTHWVLLDGTLDLYECAICGNQVTLNRYGNLPNQCSNCGRTIKT